jgi:putative ABC transport system ATP-binding protein
MERNLFKYIWRHSKAEQVWVLCIVLISMPFYFVALDLPKSIVNGPIQGQGFEQPGATATFLEVTFGIPQFLEEQFGQTVTLLSGFDMERIEYLIALSLLFLFFVCINGLFKYYINSYKGRMGERMLRRLRYELVDRMLRFPILHFRKVRSSEMATMVKDEVEPLGGFIGEAFVSPLFLGGQAATALLFIILQSFWLGALAAGIVLSQALLIPRLRKRLLILGKERQLTARELAGRVGEIVDGVAEVRLNDASNFERADITRRLGRIFWVRYEIYQRKFFVKFVNNFMAQFTPFLFYLIGGYFAIRGSLDIGQLVAVIAAYKDLPSPIKELIDWDQRRQDVEIKYGTVVEQFGPDNMIDPELQRPDPGPAAHLEGNIEVRRLTLTDESGARLVEGVSFAFEVGEHLAAVGTVNAGGEFVAEALAKLIMPSSGSILINGRDLHEIPEAVTGRRISFVGPDVYLRAQSVAENLMYGLRHVPSGELPRNEEEQKERAKRVHEATLAGNLALDPDADWTDYAAAGVSGPEDLYTKLIELLNQVGLATDVYEFGLRGTIDPKANEALAADIVRARAALRERLEDPALGELVTPFDPERYNGQATVAENLLFGTPVGTTFAAAKLATNPYLLEILQLTKLHDGLLEMGRSIAETVVELFADLPPDHPFFEQVSFMSAEDLPEFEAITKRVQGAALADAPAADKARLLSLPFSYIEPRHRLGLMDEEMEGRVLEARRLFRDKLPHEFARAIEFYDPERYNAASILQDNILLGRVAYGIAGAEERVGEAVRNVLAELELTPAVFRVGLEFNVGSGGKRLNVVQRQKIGLARALIRRPDLLIVNRALAALEPATQERIINAVREVASADGHRTAIFWALAGSALAHSFDRVLLFEEGRLTRTGRPEEILRESVERETVDA